MLIIALLLLLFYSGFSPFELLSSSKGYVDPFAYCRAVGTADAPDERYVGPKVPERIARGLRAVFQVAETKPLEPFLERSVWRCADGEVYACSFGANLPCMEKADLSQSPSMAMEDYCRSQGSAGDIPMVVTGRATVYQWRCVGGVPRIVRQLATPDAEGFLSHIWHQIPENQPEARGK